MPAAMGRTVKLDPGPCIHIPYGWDCAVCHDDPPGDLCPRCGRTRPDGRYPWASEGSEEKRAAIAWELTGMLGIEICPLGDGWVLDAEQVAAWWEGLGPRTRAAIADAYRESARALAPERHPH
jgi:hypothetical protein